MGLADDYLLLNNFLAKLGINNISPDQLRMLEKYYHLILEWNKKFNLTAITEKYDVINKHFADSLALLKFLKSKSYNHILDVGAGAGLPGIPISLVLHDKEVVLLEPNKKKCLFLSHVSEILKINTTVINGRAEEYIRGRRESSGIVISRALANLPIALELCAPFVCRHGYYIYMAGPSVEINTGKLNYYASHLAMELNETFEYELPEGSGRRKLLIFKKSGITDPKYPRQFSKIKKSALFSTTI